MVIWRRDWSPEAIERMPWGLTTRESGGGLEAQRKLREGPEEGTA